MTKVLMTTDRKYKDLAPLCMALWSRFIGFEPVLFHICEPNEPVLSLPDGEVIRVPKLEYPHKVAQCQWYRLWAARQYPGELCMISDIDLMPMNRNFFYDLLNFSFNHPGILCHTHDYEEDGLIRKQVCYFIGYSDMWDAYIPDVPFPEWISKQHYNYRMFDGPEEEWLSRQESVRFLARNWARDNDVPSRSRIKHFEEPYQPGCIDAHLPVPGNDFYLTDEYSHLLRDIQHNLGR
jgi:hypothetical protein